MNANKKNVGGIFDPSIRFVAPLFQRPYVWNEEKNWIPLWESIHEVASRRLQGAGGRPYFLGAIVLELMDTRTGEVEARQIIDGQQRLTTLQIALSAMRDFASSKGSDQYHEGFKRLTENFVPSSNPDESKFKVWPTNVDRTTFKSVISGSPKTDPHSLMHKAYRFFYDCIEEWFLAHSETPAEKLFSCLMTAMRQDLLIVVIDLEADDDAQLIFETMNALGTPLLPADLVKNYLFHKLAGPEHSDLNLQAIYDQYWKEFDDNKAYWREEIVQGRLKRPRIDLFLHHYLVLKTKKEVNVGHLFGVFKDFVASLPKLGPVEHMRMFREYADVYRSFDFLPEDSKEKLFFDRLEELDNTTVLPLLLEVFKNPVSQADKDNIIADVESYLMRRSICGLTTKGYNNTFLDLLKFMYEKSFRNAPLRAYLLSRQGDTSRWPDDEEVTSACLSLAAYRRARSAVRVVLKAYERSLRNEKTEKYTLDDENLSIEHVMPREWEKKWPLNAHDAEEEREMTDRRNALIDTLGNLTLITGKLNAAQSNKPWEMKREKLREYSILAMNRYLCENNEWTDDLIEARGKKILGGVLKTWLRPIYDEVLQKIELPKAVVPMPVIRSRNKPSGDGTEQVMDREYWISRSHPKSMELFDKLVELSRAFDPRVDITYNKHHIALGTTLKNFSWYHPRKKEGYCHFNIRVGRNNVEKAKGIFEKNGLEARLRTHGEDEFAIQMLLADLEAKKAGLNQLFSLAIQTFS